MTDVEGPQPPILPFAPSSPPETGRGPLPVVPPCRQALTTLETTCSSFSKGTKLSASFCVIHHKLILSITPSSQVLGQVLHSVLQLVSQAAWEATW